MNRRLACIGFILLFVIGCGSKQAVKQDRAADAAPQVESLKLPDIAPLKETKEEKKPQEKTVAEKKQEEQYVLLNFENADIETVVSTISDMLKINYILAPGVSGKITIQSHNKIPISELFSTFQTVLEFNGFTAVKEGSYYRIVPIDTAKQQPVPVQAGKKQIIPKDSSFVTQEVPLEYVKANDVANVVRNLMPRGTDIIVYEPSNMLIVTSPPAGMVKFLKLLEAIDIPSTERDSVRTFIYNVENGEAKKLAEVLKNLYTKKSTTSAPAAPGRTAAPTPQPSHVPQPATATRPRTPAQPAVTGATLEGVAGELEGEVVIEAYDDINALLIKASPRAYLTLLDTIKRIDVQPKQVLIEVLIAEISLDDTTKLGLEWLLKGNVHYQNRSTADVIGGFTTGQVSYDSDAGNFVFSPADKFFPTAYANIFDPAKFSLLINAAANSGKVNVLASPHILALDNKEAKIEIADEVPVATSITSGSVDATNPTNTTSQVQFKSAGTILTVTPHINEKKQVTLKIVQEVSELGEVVPIGSGSFQGFKTRKANTSAIVQDGHTLVIGGILTERKEQSRAGIPVLSKIPLLGYLFGTTTDSVRKKELILMVTPHVVANHEEADHLTQDYKNRVKGLKDKIDERNKQSEVHLHKHNGDEKKD